MKIGEKIRNLRKSHNISQEKFAEVLSIDRRTLSRWENGDSEPTATDIKNIDNYFNLSPEYLLGEDDNAVIEISKSREPSVTNNKKSLRITPLKNPLNSKSTLAIYTALVVILMIVSCFTSLLFSLLFLIIALVISIKNHLGGFIITFVILELSFYILQLYMFYFGHIYLPARVTFSFIMFFF